MWYKGLINSIRREHLCKILYICNKSNTHVRSSIYRPLTPLDTSALTFIYSNKKDTSDFHGTVSFDPIKMSQQKIDQNVYQTSDTQKLVII